MKGRLISQMCGGGGSKGKTPVAAPSLFYPVAVSLSTSGEPPDLPKADIKRASEVAYLRIQLPP
jgi:hypothetical protein